MGFKLPGSREEIGDSLYKDSVNCDISPNYPLCIKGEREIRLLLEGRMVVIWTQKTEWLGKVRWWDIVRLKDRK